MSEPSPFAAAKASIRVRVRLTPKAAHDRIGALHRDADGALALKVAVTAAPEGGKANAALIRALAKAWRLPRTSMAISAGAAARRKTVTVAGDPGVLMRHVETWMEGRHG